MDARIRRSKTTFLKTSLKIEDFYWAGTWGGTETKLQQTRLGKKVNKLLTRDKQTLKKHTHTHTQNVRTYVCV